MLNRQTKTDAYPIPEIDKILDCFFQSLSFFEINLGKVYHQVAIEPSHMHKTALLSKYGLLKF